MVNLRFVGHATLLVLAVGLSLTLGHTAGAVENVDWDDLTPPWDELENPVNQLSDKQREALYAIVWGPNFGDPSGKKSGEEQKAYDDLKASGVDAVAILAKIEKLREEAEEHNRTLVPDLDGRNIRLAGYVLPLDFDGTMVKSFLLVPYVGACIHVPPPPPNQIVHVEAGKPFLSETLFAPVWVTGLIRVGMDTKSLSLVDGSSDVAFGYSLEATNIEPYKE